ncbi:hypothetical protein HMSSN036_30480 [Paenibacillus macerans]|nr:hypothetical protein HMSSN036_30480 [Paenibacillus macerans]
MGAVDPCGDGGGGGDMLSRKPAVLAVRHHEISKHGELSAGRVRTEDRKYKEASAYE